MKLIGSIICIICISLEVFAQGISLNPPPIGFISASAKPNLLKRSHEYSDSTDLKSSGVLSYQYSTIGIPSSATHLPKSGSYSKLYSEGSTRFDKMLISGYFDYRQSKYESISWQLRNPTQGFSPLIVADSIKSDWQINTLRFGARIKAIHGNLRPEFAVGYKTSYAGKNIDPRSKSNLIQVQTEPGNTWFINNKTHVYTSLFYNYLKEDIDIIHNGQTTESVIFKLIGHNLFERPTFTNTFRYRYTIHTAGGKISWHKIFAQSDLKVIAHLIRSYDSAINDPYGYLMTGNNQIALTSSTDASMVQMFNSATIVYQRKTINNIKNRFKLLATNNNGSTLNNNTLYKANENKWSEFGFDWLQKRPNVFSAMGITATYTASEITTHHLVNQTYNYAALNSFTTIKPNLHPTINFKITPAYLFEYHTFNDLKLFSDSPFIKNNPIITEQVVKPNFKYFGSNKHKATLSTEMNFSTKKQRVFLRYVLTYIDICSTNATQWHNRCILGVQF